MVADITEKERAAEEMRNSILPTTRLQLTFGAHVLVTMFTFFAVAYYGSKWFFGYSELWVSYACMHAHTHVARGRGSAVPTGSPSSPEHAAISRPVRAAPWHAATQVRWPIVQPCTP